MKTKCTSCEKEFRNESFATAQSQLAQHREIVHPQYSGGLRDSHLPNSNQTFILKHNGQYYIADDEELTNDWTKALQLSTQDKANSECAMVSGLWGIEFTIFPIPDTNDTGHQFISCDNCLGCNQQIERKIMENETTESECTCEVQYFLPREWWPECPVHPTEEGSN